MLSTPLPLIVPRLLRVERGRVVLEILDQRAGLGTLVEDLGLAFVDLAAAEPLLSLHSNGTEEAGAISEERGAC